MRKNPKVHASKPPFAGLVEAHLWCVLSCEAWVLAVMKPLVGHTCRAAERRQRAMASAHRRRPMHAIHAYSQMAAEEPSVNLGWLFTDDKVPSTHDLTVFI